MEEKKRKKPTKEQLRKDALDHVERIRQFGPPHYKKENVVKILRAFIDLYMS